MAIKKISQETGAKKQSGLPNITVKIDRLVDYEGSRLKAVASANIGGAFVVHGIKIIDGEKGLFVSMPQSSYKKDGKTYYNDIFHPVVSEAHTALFNSILNAYQSKLQKKEIQDQNAEMATEESFHEQRI